jgi:hypothetical protein
MLAILPSVNQAVALISIKLLVVMITVASVSGMTVAARSCRAQPVEAQRNEQRVTGEC